MNPFNSRYGAKTLVALLSCGSFVAFGLLSFEKTSAFNPLNTLETQETQTQCPPLLYQTAAILPSQPTDKDDVRVVVFGVWRNRGYDIAWTHRIENRVITIEITTTQKPGTWPDHPTEWQFTENIGKLKPGFYLVEVRWDDGGLWRSYLYVTMAPGERTVTLGETLKFAFPQALNPGYGWTLKAYDPAYLELIQEGFEPPPGEDRLFVGSTAKVFVFQAIKEGQTQVIFSNCELDSDGGCIKELEGQTHEITIK